MIVGIGFDLCSISRIKRALDFPGFVERVFSKEEIKYCESKKLNKYESYASSFAAREAFAKASGINLFKLFGEKFCVKRVDGKPEIIISSEILCEIKIKIKFKKIHVSLTHDGDFTGAFIILEEW